MENAPFAQFERGDIVGIYNEPEHKLFNKFLILEKKEGKYFGYYLTETRLESHVDLRGQPMEELKNPNICLKECSVKID